MKHIHKFRRVHIASFLALVTLVTGLVLNAPTARAADAGVVYHGGPVVAGDMKVYVIFWEPPGSFVSTGYHRLLKRFFKDVGDASLYEINEQYADTLGHAPTGAVLADAFVDTSPYPSAPFILDSDIRREVVHAMNVNGWTPGIDHAFFVFTALNTLICSPFGTCSAPASSLCAYHFGFGTVGGPVLYAAMPYAGTSLADCYGLAASPNRDIDADAEINLASHEQMEIATDPEATGWFGPGGIFDEIGDKCAGLRATQCRGRRCGLQGTCLHRAGRVGQHRFGLRAHGSLGKVLARQQRQLLSRRRVDGRVVERARMSLRRLSSSRSMRCVVGGSSGSWPADTGEDGCDDPVAQG